MGPVAANPKATATDNMTVNGVEDPDIATAADTVYLTSDGDPLPSGAFTWMELPIDGYGDNALQWISSRKGWAYYEDGIIQDDIQVFIYKRVGYGFNDSDPIQWQVFDEYVQGEFDDDERPSLTITDNINELFRDPEEVLERIYDPDTSPSLSWESG